MAENLGKQKINLENFSSRVTKTVAAGRCIQGWLGYASVLFLGFGTGMLLPTEQRDDGEYLHPQPDHEMTIEQADWTLNHRGTFIASKNRADNKDLLILIGARVTNWELHRDIDGALQAIFYFDYHTTLNIILPSENDSAEKEAWGVRNPDGYYYIMTCSGQTFRIHENEPT